MPPLINPRYLALLGLALIAVSATPPLKAAERPQPEMVRALATKVADWQIDTFHDAYRYRAIAAQRYKERYTDRHLTPQNHHELDWTNGVLYIGMDQFRSIARDRRHYTDWLVEIGDRNGWRPYFRPYFADDQTASQAFLSIYEERGDPAMMREVDRVLRYVLRYPKTGSLDYIRDPETWAFTTDALNRWGWCDALFMAPPIWARMAKIKEDPTYLEFMHQEWLATYELLWSEEHKLFFRDSRFITQTEENGQPLFWSRGNGWVLSGLALTIPHLPKDWEARYFYIRVLQEMATTMKATQRQDGTWHMGLLGDLEAYPVKESSGTALITHGLAWGINQGYLDRTTYEPAVLRAWAALAASVNEEGIFGYVHPIGAQPGESFPNKTEVYAVGAFLLAATEVYHLVQPPAAEGSR
jgi:rhamnogalacturonyl hydrolase YesR